MKLIDISTKKYPNKYAIVDDCDFDSLSKYKWYFTKNGYVSRSLTMLNDGRVGAQYMHRQIMCNPDSAVDHMNLNKLDNRRSNLRLASRQGNSANTKGRSVCGFKGVCFHKETKKWRSRIMVDYKQISLGLFYSPEEASKAYISAARKHFGEFYRS